MNNEGKIIHRRNFQQMKKEVERNKNNISIEKRPVENTQVIAHRVAEDLMKLKDNLFYHFNMVKALDKRISVESHNLEIVHKMTDGEEKEQYRQQILNQIETLSEKRRWHKDQHYLITKLSKPIKTDNNEINLTHLINIFSGIQECTKEHILINCEERNGIYTEEEPSEDLEKQFKELREKYENVFFDKHNRKVIAYNNSTIGRKFYK